MIRLRLAMFLPIASIWWLLGCAANTPTLQSDGRWYSTRDIVDSIHDEHQPVTVDRAAAENIFVDNQDHLAADWRDRLPPHADALAPHASPWPTDPRLLADMRARESNSPRARVDQFSADELVIFIDLPPAQYLWHLEIQNLAVIRTPRTPKLDQIFDLPSLESTYASRFHGLSQGDSADDVVARAGKPDRKEYSQPAGYYRMIYQKENVSIEIENERIVSIYYRGNR